MIVPTPEDTHYMKGVTRESGLFVPDINLQPIDTEDDGTRYRRLYLPGGSVLEEKEVMTLKAKIELLESAGFTISYASRAEWFVPANQRYSLYQEGHWRIDETCPAYVLQRNTYEHPEENTRAYVDLQDIGQDESTGSSGDCVSQSNYRSLKRDYPDTFTDLSYANVDCLGAFVGNLTPDVIRTLCTLKCDYIVYDDEDHSALESEWVAESYDAYAKRDFAESLGNEHTDLWNALEDVKFADDKDAQEDTFWHAVWANQGNDFWSCNGHEIDWHYEMLAQAVSVILDDYFSANETDPFVSPDQLTLFPTQTQIPATHDESGNYIYPCAYCGKPGGHAL